MNFLEGLKNQIETTNLRDESVLLALPDCTISIRSNSQIFLNEIKQYFQSTLAKQSLTPDTEIIAIQAEPYDESKAPWIDWIREPGKAGRKDAFIDLDTLHERLLYKVKTGMLFWQKPQKPTAIGEIENHPNQIINFILNQYLNEHLRKGWALGHAAGLQINGKGLAIAGLSGGGKSTLMLHLLESGEHFISNDRLVFKKAADDSVIMRGIPKQPRINPGTIVHNTRLKNLITPDKTRELLALPTEELRKLEDKYDADVDTFFGKGCYQPETYLDTLIILNWSPNATESTQLHKTTLKESPELIPALMKSAGPFYSDIKGNFIKNGKQPDPTPYLKELGDIPCYVLTGKIDFSDAVTLIQKQILN